LQAALIYSLNKSQNTHQADYKFMSVIFFHLETVATNIDQMLHHSIAVHGQQAIINRSIDLLSISIFYMLSQIQTQSTTEFRRQKETKDDEDQP